VRTTRFNVSKVALPAIRAVADSLELVAGSKNASLRLPITAKMAIRAYFNIVEP